MGHSPRRRGSGFCEFLTTVQDMLIPFVVIYKEKGAGQFVPCRRMSWFHRPNGYHWLGPKRRRRLRTRLGVPVRAPFPIGAAVSSVSLCGHLSGTRSWPVQTPAALRRRTSSKRPSTRQWPGSHSKWIISVCLSSAGTLTNVVAPGNLSVTHLPSTLTLYILLAVSHTLV